MTITFMHSINNFNKLWKDSKSPINKDRMFFFNNYATMLMEFSYFVRDYIICVKDVCLWSVEQLLLQQRMTLIVEKFIIISDEFRNWWVIHIHEYGDWAVSLFVYEEKTWGEGTYPGGLSYSCSFPQWNFFRTNKLQER